MRIGLMVEGQANLTWERWIHILHTAERLGFPSVFRSDHYVIGKYQNSLDLYLSFMIAARETENIRFGSLVSPMTFRSPIDVGRMSAQINQLSNGRLMLGLGAGWHKPEHDAYGIPFYSERVRSERLEEAINVIKTLWGPGPASYQGKHFSVTDVDCLPKPVFGADTPILIGGAGEKRTLGLVAKYADEWNCVVVQPETYQHKLNVITDRCNDLGRDISTVHQSMMVFGLIAHDERQLDRFTKFHMNQSGATGSPAAYRAAKETQSNWITGLTGEVVDKLAQFAHMGIEEIQFQHFNFHSDEVPEYLASEIVPRVAAL
jgi:alkanesulfonate monooxygenase SsuD/methylene tetrahydromethanopterin reductase-like flavin-dependent oxidoreductase (luciferase family)